MTVGAPHALLGGLWQRRIGGIARQFHHGVRRQTTSTMGDSARCVACSLASGALPQGIFPSSSASPLRDDCKGPKRLTSCGRPLY